MTNAQKPIDRFEECVKKAKANQWNELGDPDDKPDDRRSYHEILIGFLHPIVNALFTEQQATIAERNKRIGELRELLKELFDEVDSRFARREHASDKLRAILDRVNAALAEQPGEEG